MPEIWEKPQADADHAHEEYIAEIEEGAMDVFDNHYDGPSDPASFRRAVAEVWIEAIKIEREACAVIATQHKGSAAKARHEKGQKLSGLEDGLVVEIIAEERGEEIAAETIAGAIRARP